MQFQILLTLASAMAVSAAGVTLPQNMENGMYSADPKTGKLTKVGDLKAVPDFIAKATKMNTTAPPQSAKFKRTALPAGQEGCTSNGLVVQDLTNAQYQLEDYCGASASLPSPGHLVWSVNNAVAYACNYGGKNTCASQEAQAAFAILAGDCGTASAPLGGWYFIKDWAKTYGYQTAGQSICANGA